MTINHTHEEMFKVLAPDAEFYGGVELIGHADDWGRVKYSFRDLQARGMDKRTLIRLFASSPKIPAQTKRTFACLCAARVLPLYRYSTRFDDLPARLLQVGWQLVRGMDARGRELISARRSASEALFHRWGDEMAAYATFEAVRSTLAQAPYIAAENAAYHAQQARYYAVIRNKKGEKAACQAIDSERNQQIADIITLTEKQPVVVIRKSRKTETMA